MLQAGSEYNTFVFVRQHGPRDVIYIRARVMFFSLSLFFQNS